MDAEIWFGVVIQIVAGTPQNVAKVSGHKHVVYTVAPQSLVLLQNRAAYAKYKSLTIAGYRFRSTAFISVRLLTQPTDALISIPVQ